VLYLDSSALAKKYILEKGSEAIQQRITAQTGADAIPFTSILTYAEILSVFARRAKKAHSPRASLDERVESLRPTGRLA